MFNCYLESQSFVLFLRPALVSTSSGARSVSTSCWSHSLCIRTVRRSIIIYTWYIELARRRTRWTKNESKWKRAHAASSRRGQHNRWGDQATLLKWSSVKKRSSAGSDAAVDMAQRIDPAWLSHFLRSHIVVSSWIPRACARWSPQLYVSCDRSIKCS